MELQHSGNAASIIPDLARQCVLVATYSVAKCVWNFVPRPNNNLKFNRNHQRQQKQQQAVSSALSSAAWITQPTLFQFSQLRATAATTTTDRITKLPLLGTLKCYREWERQQRQGGGGGACTSAAADCVGKRERERGKRAWGKEVRTWNCRHSQNATITLFSADLFQCILHMYFCVYLCVWEWTCACVCYQHATQSVAKATQKLQLWLWFHSNTASECDSWRASQAR